MLAMRTIMVALVATMIPVLASTEEATSPAPPTGASQPLFALLDAKSAPRPDLRTIVPYRSQSYVGADKPFETNLVRPDGRPWPLYATANVADEVADVLRSEAARHALPAIVVEICRLKQLANGSWTTVVGRPWKERVRYCTWRGGATG